ncbi:MAG: metallopeptidase TldD-related protein [Intestinibacter sp.]
MQSSYASSVSVSPSNFYIEKGDKSFDEVLNTLGEGLLLQSLQGFTLS